MLHVMVINHRCWLIRVIMKMVDDDSTDDDSDVSGDGDGDSRDGDVRL